MRLALLASNYYKIDASIAKGTEAWLHSFARGLFAVIHAKRESIDVTCFASGDSDLPFPIVTNRSLALTLDTAVTPFAQKLYELSLISKAFSRAEAFDFFHVNISNGEYVLPLARFVKKPIVFTLHGGINESYDMAYFDQFANLSRCFFVSISNAQRKRLPHLRYIETIYHGIDLSLFPFNSLGGGDLAWAGRAVREKGLDQFLDVVALCGKKGKFAAIVRDEWKEWYQLSIVPRIDNMGDQVGQTKNLDRAALPAFFSDAKLFLFPVGWEEPFGLVTIESMAVGTPVVAYARGALPEIIVDGKTGYLVNPSDDDIRGDFMIKKTGTEGLREAVERIYALSTVEYKAMRHACRARVEEQFTLDTMVDSYIEIYKKLTQIPL